MTTSTSSVARITVDLPRGDYDQLKLAAAIIGRGASMASIMRQLVHNYLSDAHLEDALRVDSGLVLSLVVGVGDGV